MNNEYRRLLLNCTVGMVGSFVQLILARTELISDNYFNNES